MNSLRSLIFAAHGKDTVRHLVSTASGSLQSPPDLRVGEIGGVTDQAARHGRNPIAHEFQLPHRVWTGGRCELAERPADTAFIPRALVSRS